MINRKIYKSFICTYNIKMTQKTAHLDKVLLRMEELDMSFVSGDLYDAMRSAVQLNILL